jgi:hypothetical protein
LRWTCLRKWKNEKQTNRSEAWWILRDCKLISCIRRARFVGNSDRGLDSNGLRLQGEDKPQVKIWILIH